MTEGRCGRLLPQSSVRANRADNFSLTPLPRARNGSAYYGGLLELSEDDSKIIPEEGESNPRRRHVAATLG